MNKLQLYITKSSSSYKSLFNLNPSEDVRRYVRNVTDAVQLIDYQPQEKNIFYMLSAIDEGVFFTILRTIPPHKGNHLAAWIFIPNGVRIDSQRLLDLINLTTRKVSNAEVTNDDVAALREAFSAEYPSSSDAPLLTGTRGTKYAWRPYSADTGVTLADFCGAGIWQQSYIPFAGVLLVDDALGYTVHATGIGDMPLGEPAVILPPEKTENEFTAYIFGRKLKQPMLGTVGAELTVSWRRPGFEDVEVTEPVSSRQFTPSLVSTTGSHKIISTQSFFITSQTNHERLTNCAIHVNGRDITDTGRPFTSDELHSANVSVTCEGHFPYSGKLDLASSTRALIQLQERLKIYRFEMPLTSSDYGAPVRFDLKTKKPITESPVEGYILLDDIQEGPTRTNHLGFVGGRSPLLVKAIWAGIGIVAGVLLTLAFGMCSRNGGESSRLAPAANPDSVVPNTVVAPPTPPVENVPEAKETAQQPAPPEAKTPQAKPTDKPSAADVESAVKYMESTTQWNRAELDKNPATRGLFDDMNNYNADRIINYWGPRFKDSKRFGKVVLHVQQGQQKKKAKLDGTYNKAGDDIISVQSYLNRVDP